MSITVPAIKARSITRLTYPVSLRTNQRPSTFLSLQNRNYADGATEAEHGDDSIAASADTNASTSAEEAEQIEATLDAESDSGKAAEQASATADSLKSAAQTAGETLTGAAQSLGEAAGLDIGKPETSKSVYVGNLFFDVTGEDLRQEFEKAGPVVDVKIIMDPRGLSKGFVISFPACDTWCLIYIDLATSTSKTPNLLSVPSICTICRIFKAVAFLFSSRSMPPAPAVVLPPVNTITRGTPLPKLSLSETCPST